MHLPDSPKKQLLLLAGICAVILILALVIGLISKNNSSATNRYVVETELVD